MNKHKQSLLGFCLVVFVCLCALPRSAGALTFSDFLSTYKDIEHYVGSSEMPISSETLGSCADLFNCVAGGGNVGVCADDFINSPSGEKVVRESAIPSEVFMVLNAYAHYVNEEYLECAWDLGGAVVCGALQVMCGGIDVCGWVDRIYGYAKDVCSWTGACEDAVGFLKDIGGGIVAGLRSAGCNLDLCCCDDRPPPPTYEEIVQGFFNLWFKPKLADGLTAIEQVNGDAAFRGLRGRLESEGKKSCMVMYYQSYISIRTEPGKHTSEDQVRAALSEAEGMCKPAHISGASELFAKGVDINWSKDISTKVVVDLERKRKTYEDPATLRMRVNGLARQALDEFQKNKKNPRDTILIVCADYFRKTLGFEHIDRWIEAPHEGGVNTKALTSNTQWCRDFFSKNQNDFVAYFRDQVKTKCPEQNGKLECPTNEDYVTCGALMSGITGNGSATPSASASMKGAVASISGGENQWCRGPAKVLSPKATYAPKGQSGSSATAAVSAADTSVMTVYAAKKPDLVTGAGVSVADKSASWGGALTLDTSALKSKDGVCDAEVKYQVKNAGTAGAGKFAVAWTNSAIPGTLAGGREWPNGLPAGGFENTTTTVKLKPGPNTLTLELDPSKQVAESDDINNKYSLVVNVSGTCGAQMSLQKRPDTDTTPIQKKGFMMKKK